MLEGIDLFYPLKLIYQKTANSFRDKNCDKKKTRKLLPGEIHPLCANFEGPGTRIDLPEVRNFEPYNGVDSCAKTHDIDYYDASKIADKVAKSKMIRIADEKFNNCIESYKNEGLYYKLAKGIALKNSIEDSIIGKFVIPDGYYGVK